MCVSLGQHPCWGGGFYYLLGPWHDQLGLFRGQTLREKSVEKVSLILCFKTKSRERRWRESTCNMSILNFSKDRINNQQICFVKKKKKRVKISSLCISWLSAHLGDLEDTQTKYSGWGQGCNTTLWKQKTEGSADCQLHIHKAKFLWFQLAWSNLRSALSVQIISNTKYAHIIIRLQEVWPNAHN